MGEVLLEQRVGDTWYRVRSIDSFTSVYEKAKPYEGDWFWFYTQTFTGETAHMGAERAFMDEVLKAVYQ